MSIANGFAPDRALTATERGLESDRGDGTNAGADESKAYRFVINLVYERCRIRLHEGKEPMIQARLGGRLRRLGLTRMSDYCDYLCRQGNEEEVDRLVDALTTNYTSFLREPAHYQFMIETAIPALTRDGNRQFSVWSAACATGEEAYSIAFHLAEHMPLAAGWDWRVSGTDISWRALDRARKGIDPMAKVEKLPTPWVQRYFQRGEGEWTGFCRVKPRLAGRIEWMRGNLTAPLRFSRQFEMIYCRNVLIYFDLRTQKQVIENLLPWLMPGGYLMIGCSESLIELPDSLRCVRPSIYQKVTN